MRFTAIVLFLVLISCGSRQSKQKQPAKPKSQSTVTQTAPGHPAGSFTRLTAHHVSFAEPSGLSLKIGWLDARMYPTHKGVNPSFDEPDSFDLNIEDGMIGVDLSGLSNLLGSDVLKGSHLTNVKLSSKGQQVKLNAILHKVVPVPIEMLGDVAASPDGRIQIHVAKLDILGIPVKGLLTKLHVEAADLVNTGEAKGVQVSGNDVYLDPNDLLPPPHNIGKIKGVHIAKSGDLVMEYGDAREDLRELRKWRNFMRLRGGTIDIGKLTMRDADVFLIDTSGDKWFEFDLAHYQEQLVNGYTEVTPTAGLEIFMPDISRIPKTQANRDISLQWVRNRNIPPPENLQ